MAPSILTIPLEILININSYLYLEDYINLRNSRIKLFRSLNGESASRAFISGHQMRYSGEAEFAQKGTCSYSTAIQRASCVRTRFAHAQPCSAILLGYGVSLQHYKGMLRYVDGHCIRMLEFISAAKTEQVLDVISLLNFEVEGWPSHTQGLRRLLSGTDFEEGCTYLACIQVSYGRLPLYIALRDLQEGMLSFSLRSHGNGPYFLIVDIRNNVKLEDRVRKIATNVREPIMRTDSRRYAFVAAKTAAREQVILCYDLEDKERVMPQLQLKGFRGDEDTVSFFIHDGWFYAACWKHLGLTGDDGDEESYYYYYRFPVNDFHPVHPWKVGDDSSWSPHCPLPARMEIVRIKRPQYQVPYIDDSELLDRSLTLWFDEESGHLAIQEVLQDTRPGALPGAIQFRYQPLVFPDSPTRVVDSIDTQIADIVQTLDYKNLPKSICIYPISPYSKSSLGSRTFNYSKFGSAFYNVKFGPDKSTFPDQRPKFCLEVNPHVRTSPIDSKKGLLGRGLLPLNSVEAVKDDGEIFVDRGIYSFPPRNFFSPFPGTEGVYGATDNLYDPRSYFLTTGNPDRELRHQVRTILVNFDPWVRFPGLEKLNLQPLSDYVPSCEYDKGVAGFEDILFSDLEKQKAQKMKQARARSTTETLDSVTEYPSDNSPGPETDASTTTSKEPVEIVAMDEKGTTHSIDGASAQRQDGIQQGKPSPLNSELKAQKENEVDDKELPWFRTERARWMDLNQGFQFC